ncbi:ubiquitin family protein [Xylaria flabelliformis]|nr:ubiquitin family protein [Xylaria flabelliformis]
MADSTDGASADPQVTFKVKTSGDKLHTITMAESATVASLKAKLAGPDFEDIPAEHQRLIYSGRVMKNDESLGTYKIKSGNTVHLVKSAASNPAPARNSSSSSAPAAPQVPTNMAAGTANNPLANLTGARYAGMANLPSADMFGPDGGMTTPMFDEDQLASMLANPEVAQQMNDIMNNDQFLDLMIQANPVLRNNPNAREMIRSPIFRQMMTNPEMIRSAARMQRLMGRGGGAQGAFPMPGVTDTTPGVGNTDAGEPPLPSHNPLDPAAWANLPGLAGLAGLGNQPGSMGNLFNAFGMPAAGAGQSAPTSTTPGNAGAQTTGSANTGDNATGQGQGGNAQGTTSPPPNPFASLFGAQPNPSQSPFVMPNINNPDALQQMMQLLGMDGGSSGSPADNRPPEERYAEQLRQLNDMGFYDFDRNVAALRRSGGSVQGAVEHLLSS